MWYRLNLILNSNQGLALFRQKQIRRSNRHEHLLKRAMKFSLFNYLILGYISPNNSFLTPTFIEKILDQPIFLNLHNKLDFRSDNPYFYCIPPRNISDKFTRIRDLCRFIQPGLISTAAFDDKLGFSTANRKEYIKLLWT